MNVLVCKLYPILVVGDEELVEDGHAHEVGLGVALETGGHLDHPVGHFRSVLLGNLVTSDRIPGSCFSLVFDIRFIKQFYVVIEFVNFQINVRLVDS